jgi:4-amino-4-deoxy-L-arabinose transferase-like glycosyltransferase
MKTSQSATQPIEMSRGLFAGWPQQLLVYSLIFLSLMLLHAPLLRLPYFWDEAGYYIPSAYDLYLTGTLVPHTTPSNAHPPLVMAWLAIAWRVAGYSPLVTRIAMLAIAAFSLLGLYRLCRAVANQSVAWATTLLVTIYPPFFTQCSLAQVDRPAAGFTFWALLAYVEDRPRALALWFSIAAFRYD